MLLNVFKFNVDSIQFGWVFRLFLAIDKTRPELIRIAIVLTTLFFNCFLFSFSNKKNFLAFLYFKIIIFILGFE